MTERSAETILAEALGLHRSDITADLNIETCASWDSIAHFRVIAGIEEAIGRSLNPEEIFQATDYEQVRNLLV